MIRKKLVIGALSILAAAACNNTRTLNLAPLDTVLDSRPAAESLSANATFTFHGSSRAISFVCSLDNATPAPCTSPTTYTGLVDGAHLFAVASVAGDDTVDQTPAEANWNIDTRIPDTKIDFHPDAVATTASAAFLFESTIASSTFACTLDGAAAAACTSPLTYSNLAEGSHTFTVVATDPAGAVDPTPASYTWIIDTTPPDTTILTGPPSSTEATSITVTFSSTKPNSTFVCTLDGAQAACSSPFTASNLALGTHSFLVAAIDSNGLQDPSPAQLFFIIESAQTLQTQLTGTPDSASHFASATFNFIATLGGATFSCGLDGATATACTSPKTYTGLADGAHTFTVTAQVGALIEQNPPSFNWNIDTVAPITVLLTHPTALTRIAAATFTFASQPANDVVTFSCRLDTQAAVMCTSPFTTAALADGPHSFTVSAVDPAGNVETNPPSWTWTVDTTPPDTKLPTTPAPLSYFSDAEFIVGSTDPTGSFLCGFDTTTLTACSVAQTATQNGHLFAQLQYPTVSEGAHTLTVAAVDLAGNVDPTPASYSWTVYASAWSIVGTLPSVTLDYWTDMSSIGSFIYILGDTYNGNSAAHLWSFDTRTSPTADAGTGFVALAPSSFCTNCGSASGIVASGSKLYNFSNPMPNPDGGSASVGSSYDPSSNTWGAPLYAALPDGGADTLGETGQIGANGLIYYVGGRTNDTDVNIYNPATNRWTYEPDAFPYPSSGESMTVFNGKIYAFGGAANGSFTGTRPAVLDPSVDGGTWALETIQPDLHVGGGVSTSQAWSYAGSIYVASQWSIQSNSSFPTYDHSQYFGLNRYDPTHDTWNTNTIPFPDAGTGNNSNQLTPVVTNDGLYLVGNSQSGNNVFLTVWKYHPGP